MRQRTMHRPEYDDATPAPRRWGRRAAAGLAAAALATLGLVPFAPAPAAAACTGTPMQAQPGLNAQPWAQQRWSFDRLAELGATGEGVTVAVVDSGVDVRHPQLRGRVMPGWDAFGATNGQEDCVGHGTAVASIIAGQPVQGRPFRGLAPGVRILPIRASERIDSSSGRGEPADLANGIRQAIARRAQVINLSLVLTEDRPEVRAAIADAVASNIVVVAAAGNGHNDNGRDPTSYPAAYDGVIGVGALDESGVRFPKSQTGTYVDLMAPGGRVEVAVPGDGYQLMDGTSMATPFVSAAVALVIQKYGPNISARQVATRLMATADPVPGGVQEYGRGVVSPYRAVTGLIADSTAPARAPSIPGLQSDPAAEAAAAASERNRIIALSLAGGVGCLALIVVLIAIVVPRGRQRGWRPGTG
jgi:type VII secretion-associated serine protease mycosin